MLTRFGDFDRTFALFYELRRRMDRAGTSDDDSDWAPSPFGVAAWPRVNVFDRGANLVLTADVPGLTEKDVQLTLGDGALTISGERKSDAPQGFAVHRRERGAAKFSRSFTLPFKVDAEKTIATIKDGVLTVSLAKTPETQPRQIAVRAS
jgi:HSP20 family protein